MLITDNGLQLASGKFTVFAKAWGIPAFYIFVLSFTVLWKGQVPGSGTLVQHSNQKESALVPLSSSWNDPIQLSYLLLVPPYNRDTWQKKKHTRSLGRNSNSSTTRANTQCFCRPLSMEKLCAGNCWDRNATCMGQVGPLSYKLNAGVCVYRHNHGNHPLWTTVRQSLPTIAGSLM